MKQNGRGSQFWLKPTIITLLATVFVNEVLIYWIQTYRWPALPDVDRNSGRYQVVLLIADPQVQGYQDEPAFPVGSLARWDIDRYLWKTFSYVYEYSQPDLIVFVLPGTYGRHSPMFMSIASQGYLWKTFSYVYEYSQPDLIVFLGDLMDEGSKATPAEYKQTFERFKAIFYPVNHIKTIYIPGDNDIGGERKDFITQWKVDRYEKHFGNISDIHKFGFVDYAKLNLISHALTEEQVRVADELQQRKTSTFTVLLNHNTVMNSPKHFVYPITKRLRPKLIFSAHYHKVRVYTCDDCLQENEYSWSVSLQDLTYIDSYLQFDLSSQYSMMEWMVPTCSYRMGVPNMGYTVAVIGEDGIVQLTVLWLPRRYTMLLGYLIVLMIFVAIKCLSFYSGRRR